MAAERLSAAEDLEVIEHILGSHTSSKPLHSRVLSVSGCFSEACMHAHNDLPASHVSLISDSYSWYRRTLGEMKSS